MAAIQVFTTSSHVVEASNGFISTTIVTLSFSSSKRIFIENISKIFYFKIWTST